MKKKYVPIFMIVIMSVLLLAGCQKDGVKENANTSLKIEKEFLQQIFTSDYEERYTNFLKDDDMEAYYKSLTECTTQECLEYLQQNRIPLKYDKEAEDKKVNYNVSDIEVAYDEEGTGTFEVVFEDENNKDETAQKATGQITVENEKVESFFLSNIVSFEVEN